MNDKKMQEKQIAVVTVANMLDEAKAILKAAKEIADENAISFCLHDLYEDVTNDDVDWYSSNC